MSSREIIETAPATLRRAAALMRERAQAATPAVDGWRVEEKAGEVRVLATEKQRGGGLLRLETQVAAGTSDEECETGPWLMRHDAEHIASWHPTMAVVVADLLDAAADWKEESRITWHEADAVARAYLREGTQSEPIDGAQR